VNVNEADELWVAANIDPHMDLRMQTDLIQARAKLAMEKARLMACMAAHRAAIRAHEAALTLLSTTLNNPDDNSA